MKKVIIIGAAGRDFHNFNVVFRNNPAYAVVAFTAAQIPDIANRRYPPELAGPLYPLGIPILEEANLEKLIAEHGIDVVVFSYSDVAHASLMHVASRSVASGADFWLLGTEHTQIKSGLPVISICAVRTGCGKSPISRLVASDLRHLGWKPVVIRHPMPYGDLAAQAVQRFAVMEDLDRQQCTIEEREGMSRTFAWVRSYTPVSITRRFCARPSWRPTSSSGTAATMTPLSMLPTWRSWLLIRTGRDTNWATTRERLTCGGDRC